MCAVCRLLDDEKCVNVLLRKLVRLMKQQLDDTKTLQCMDMMHLKSFLTTEQLQQLAGDSLQCFILYSC